MKNHAGRIDEDTATVTFDRLIRADIQRVWELLSSDAGIGSWMAPADFEPRPGGQVRIDFGEDGGVVTGTVMDFDPPARLSYTWLIPGESESIVEWTLTPVEDVTQLQLVHRTVPPTMVSGYAAGWHAYLDRLEALGEGRPVPEWGERFQEMIGAYTT